MLQRLGIACAILLAITTDALSRDCGTLDTSAGRAGYCIIVADRTTNPDILYFFHPALDASNQQPERLIENGHALVLSLWPHPPTLIAVSFGPRWTLKGARLRAFLDEIMPAAEGRLPPAAGRTRRIVLGISMGGLNAYLLWAQAQPLFARGLFLCPAFSELTPYATREEIRAAADRIKPPWPEPWYWSSDHRRAKKIELLGLFMDIFRPDFASAEEWRDLQPSRLLPRLMPPATGYVVHNEADEFGFQGAANLPGITDESVRGTHCQDVLTPGAIRFLTGD